MATVFDVARYILDREGGMNSWKLQKLCYYSQAWSLAWTGNALFPEDFEAWRNGPVCPALFYKHKGQFVVHSDMIDGNPNSLSEDEKDSINRVLKAYGSMEPYELREQTHNEDPWKDARHGLPEGASDNTIITKEAMGTYYGAL